MRAILISAGQGTRLIPLTLGMPKCLVPVGGRPMLDWQLEALHGAGIDDVTVVGGYKAPQIAVHLAALPAERRPRLAFNPFWSVSSSIGSVWAARALLEGGFCLLNGDIVFTPELLADALGRCRPGVNLVVDRPPLPEHDDMRVRIEGGRVTAVGKDLAQDADYHRSLGIIVCDARGAAVYRDALDVVIARDAGPLSFHHDVVDLIARAGGVTPVLTSGHDWLEIDRPDDIAFWKQGHDAPG